MTWTAIKSQIDDSVNFTQPGANGVLECRYVRRDDTVIVYLSSQAGCRQACAMCHLTATKQTGDYSCGIQDLISQLWVVMEHAATQPRAKTLHINFMARGEPLANETIVSAGTHVFDRILQMLQTWIINFDYIKFKISTIFPDILNPDLDLAWMFAPHAPDFYYSIYSANPEIRRRLLPRAMPVDQALQILRRYQDQTHKIPFLHYALIQGVNDDLDSVHDICQAVFRAGLRVNINLVQYNPPKNMSVRLGRTSERVLHDVNMATYERVAGWYKHRMPETRIQIVPRVGIDVAASCGVFAGSDGLVIK